MQSPSVQMVHCVFEGFVGMPAFFWLDGGGGILPKRVKLLYFLADWCTGSVFLPLKVPIQLIVFSVDVFLPHCAVARRADAVTPTPPPLLPEPQYKAVVRLTGCRHPNCSCAPKDSTETNAPHSEENHKHGRISKEAYLHLREESHRSSLHLSSLDPERRYGKFF